MSTPEHRKRAAIDLPGTADRLACLKALERKALWLACWMIHQANHARPSRDGLKVGGHQASCASAATMLSALYLGALRPEDRIAVKPHAAPVFHALQYLLGRQTRAQMENYRSLGGAQSYPSRTKDGGDVHFSTGSVGLGVGATLFGSIVQDYCALHGLMPEGERMGRMVAVMGDAELDEGNIFEALLEGWKHDVRNLWWVIDYNRQSLDGVINGFLFRKIRDFFATVGWHVDILKYGKRLQRAFEGPAGEALHNWFDTCPNPLYSALCFKGGAAWREHLVGDLGGVSGFKEFLDGHDDESLHALMTNLAGHDMESMIEAFAGAEGEAPRAFVVYTVKGFGLPLAGHKDNHAGLMTPEQMAEFKRSMGIADGEEWEPFAGLDRPEDELRAFLGAVPLAAAKRPATPSRVPVSITPPAREETASTQAAFGRVLNALGKEHSAFARHIVTTSPDVTVSTGLGGWVNHTRLFHRTPEPDVFRLENVPSPQRWGRSPAGRHIELGIAENNLFLLLSALGLSDRLFGARLLPIGTLYDPFIARGLDALTYGCYSGARFIVVGTPSGLALAPEGGAHQSITTPLIGLGQDGLTALEPAFVDELAVMLEWAFDHIQQDDGGAVYLRLSTRPVVQPDRALTPALRNAILEGGYWLREPVRGSRLAIVFSGAVAPEAMEAHARIAEDMPEAGLLCVTSADRLHRDWRSPGASAPLAERLLAPLAPDADLITVLDGHPATLSWLGGVGGRRVRPLGVDHFGQSGDIPDLYRAYGIDADAIVEAAARACVDRVRR